MCIYIYLFCVCDCFFKNNLQKWFFFFNKKIDINKDKIIILFLRKKMKDKERHLDRDKNIFKKIELKTYYFIFKDIIVGLGWNILFSLSGRLTDRQHELTARPLLSRFRVFGSIFWIVLLSFNNTYSFPKLKDNLKFNC